MVYELMIKTERLEAENKTLKDENYGLRIKRLDLQKVLENPAKEPGNNLVTTLLRKLI